MIAMDIIILVLFISSIGSVQQTVCQDVEIRGPTESQPDLDGSASTSGGGQSRTIYSQRHLSPHRMMHFGKRPINSLPPTLNTMQGYYDGQSMMPAAYATMAAGAPLQTGRQAFLQKRHQKSFVSDRNYQQLPFQYFELGNGQVLKALPEEDAISNAQIASSYSLPIDKNLLYNYVERFPGPTTPNNNNNQLTFEAMNNDDASYKRGQQLLRELIGQRQESGNGLKLLKLLENDDSKSSSSPSSSSSSSSSSSAAGAGANEEVNNGEQTQDNSNNQQDPNAINISTRSMHSPRVQSNTLSLPKNYVTTLWFHGRQGSSSLPTLSAYNKKAEPKDNFFMHFGRK